MYSTLASLSLIKYCESRTTHTHDKQSKSRVQLEIQLKEREREFGRDFVWRFFESSEKFFLFRSDFSEKKTHYSIVFQLSLNRVGRHENCIKNSWQFRGNQALITRFKGETFSVRKTFSFIPTLCIMTNSLSHSPKIIGIRIIFQCGKMNWTLGIMNSAQENFYREKCITKVCEKISLTAQRKMGKLSLGKIIWIKLNLFNPSN